MKNRTILDIARVSASNVISLVASVLVSFLIPKITSVTDFGYYKSFTLYLSYIGLLHFGFCDGIYLKYAGCELSELNKEKFRFYYRTLVVMELSISFCVFAISAAFASADMKFIILMLSVYSFFHLSSSHYQLVSQATSRFGELSSRTIIYSLLRLTGIFLLWLIYLKTKVLFSFRVFIVFAVVLEVALAVWYVYTYRELSFGKAIRFENGFKEIPHLIKIGFPLLITNLASTLLLTLDRQFVNVLFPKDQYAVYAFAYSMLSLVTVATSAVAKVLFPKMNRATKEELKNAFTFLIGSVLCLVFGGLCLYFPLDIFIRWFLPKYESSLIIFKIIFPGLAVSSVISVVIYNYYKTLGMTVRYLKICIFIILFSALANYVAFIMFGTTTSISWASILSLTIWYLAAEYYFVSSYHLEWKRNFLYLLLMMLCFYVISSIPYPVIAMVLYLGAFAALVFLLQRDNIKKLRSLVQAK